jgi:Flp pilus assembly protein TadD
LLIFIRLKRIPTAPAKARPALTRSRRWAFRVIALLSPVLLLAGVEILLRLVGYGYPTGFFLPQRIDGQEVLTENWQFGWRYFPRQLARTPQPLRFTPQKAPGTVRLFVLGESAAMGDPQAAFGLPRMLQAQLELKFPGHKFEVINVAMTAINSHAIREIARDCAPLGGDVWILYAGNNEVVGPFGSGTVFGRQTPGLAVIRASLWASRLRVAQLFDSLAPRGAPEWEGMEMFLRQQVPRSDPRMAKVYSHFRANLRDIVRTGTDAGAKVILSTVAVNLRDCPPFASQTVAPGNLKDQAAFAQALKEGEAAARRGAFAEALAAFRLAQTLAESNGTPHAGLLFQLGRCELALGNGDTARTWFNAAREQDTLRFRADAEINQLILEPAVNSGAAVVDAARLLAAQCTNQLPGAEYFYEHVHLTFEGNYQLARALFDDLARALPAGVTNGAAAGYPTLEDCARRLAWTDWEQLQVFEEVRQRLQQPPFSGQSGHAARDTEWAQRIQTLRAGLTPQAWPRLNEQYLTALRLAPGDWLLRERYAQCLEAHGENPHALLEWQEVLRLLPHSVPAHYHLGNLLDSAGRSAEAVPLFRAALERSPDGVEVHNGLGLALANLGQLAEAEREFNTALRLQPKFAVARVNLGQLLGRQGRTNEAIAQYELALRQDTNNTAAHVNLGNLLEPLGDRDGARQHYEAALRIDPNHAIAHFNLGNALRATNPAAAAQHYAAAVRANPDFAEAQLALALELARANRLAEAQPHFAAALRLQPGSADAHFNYGVWLAKQGRLSEARQEFAETVKLDPNNTDARKFLQRVEQMK